MRTLLLFAVLSALSAAGAGPADAGTAAPAGFAVPALGPATNWVRLGRVSVDPVSKTVIATGFVNQVQGLIELLVCGPGGKRHESVFVMEAGATDLQSAMLLIGATNGPPMKEVGMGPPSGRPVDVLVQFGVAGTGAVHAAAVFAKHSKLGPLPPTTPWLFTGSVMEQGEFKASIEESFVVTYWDPWAIINLGLEIGASDEDLTVNPDGLPPLETPVTFLIRCRP